MSVRAELMKIHRFSVNGTGENLALSGTGIDEKYFNQNHLLLWQKFCHR